MREWVALLYERVSELYFGMSDTEKVFCPDETQVLIPTNTDREEQQQLQSPESIEAEQDEQDGYANEQTDTRTYLKPSETGTHKETDAHRSVLKITFPGIWARKRRASDNPDPSYLPP